MNYFRKSMFLAAGIVGLGLVLLSQGRPTAQADDKKEPSPEAIERARGTAKMLDDLYKNFVVQITATYVRAQERTPAARIAQKVFTAMHDKGWHRGRLVDASGDPFNVDNLPKTAFEKKAVAAIKGGKAYVEEVTTEKGQPVLEVATVVPAVMKECTVCHKGKKEGDVLGALVYTVPIK
jgi:hypothetical protein